MGILYFIDGIFLGLSISSDNKIGIFMCFVLLVTLLLNSIERSSRNERDPKE